MKRKVDKLDVDKLVSITVNLSKSCDIVKNVAARKDVYNAKIKNIEDEIPNITNLDTNASHNAKVNEFKDEIPSITNLLTNISLTVVEKKKMLH